MNNPCGVRIIYIVIVIFSTNPSLAENIVAQLPSSNNADAFEVQDVDGQKLMTVRSIGYVGIGTEYPRGPLEIQDRTDPILGLCPFGWAHIDFNGDGSINNQECWKGMLIDDAGRVTIAHRIHVVTNDISFLTTIQNPQSPVDIAQTLTSFLFKDTLETGDRNRIQLGFNANDDGGGSPSRKFFVNIEAIVEDPDNSKRKAGLRFITHGHGGPLEQMRITGDGIVGIGTPNPSHPLEMASGAHVTSGGVWTNASSREYKENIRELTTKEAITTLAGLTPTKFNYKKDKKEEYVGFISEDVPDLVATKDRKGLSPMDIVAVLTKVVQQQQKQIDELKSLIHKQR